MKHLPVVPEELKKKLRNYRHFVVRGQRCGRERARVHSGSRARTRFADRGTIVKSVWNRRTRTLTENRIPNMCSGTLREKNSFSDRIVWDSVQVFRIVYGYVYHFRDVPARTFYWH